MAMLLANRRNYALVTAVLLIGGVITALAWEPLAVDQDPLVRMPGTQPKETTLSDSEACALCHSPNGVPGEPGFSWQGSLMGQSARDFLFWASMTVAGQDSIWAFGRPNAMDLCERCHLPKGWLEGRSDPANASLMEGSDFDGVQCTLCHTMYDPFFEASFQGTRESKDWLRYWDETNASDFPSNDAAAAVRDVDKELAAQAKRFDGNPFFDEDGQPFSPKYTENGAGQYFVTGKDPQRGPYADVETVHDIEYSRYHKSKYFCSTCHDVSNPALANMEFKDAKPGDGAPVLPTEELSAFAYAHSERTFSEFMLSVYGREEGGAPGTGTFAPEQFETVLPDNRIGRCQDCHMRQVHNTDPDKLIGPMRPDESTEHPRTATPTHDLTGGNLFVPAVLASAVTGSPNYDAENERLLGQGRETLTLDLKAGMGLNAEALLDAVERAKFQLENAATIDTVTYDAGNGELTFRVQNHTGHKLISGYPEGRRMFLTVRVFAGDKQIFVVNPYDTEAGTLKGLSSNYSPNSPPLADGETYADELVYETQGSSTLTGETKTFHFVLATGRSKDNRIPPRGFDAGASLGRLAEPVWAGESALDYFTADEYAGGYDEVSLTVAPGADRIEIGLYYQTTSREYIEFLRDEINGNAKTLKSPAPSGEAEAYVIPQDPFFAGLKAWGDTIWQLWTHNKDVPGAAPFLMTQATWHKAG